MAIKEMTKTEWLAEGTRLFGVNFEDWRFECPVCGNVCAVKAYRQHAHLGARPDSATSECIGRYTGAKDINSKPCNYAGYGLFRLSPVRVLDDSIPEPPLSLIASKTIHCFAFGPPEKQ